MMFKLIEKIYKILNYSTLENPIFMGFSFLVIDILYIIQ
jgi:hypothetical protein